MTAALRAIDKDIIGYLNGYAAKSWILDSFITGVLQRPSIRLLPIVTCLVWLWFSKRGRVERRASVTGALFGTVVALVLSRLIQNLSPHRPRPLHSNTVDFVPPHGVSPDGYKDWSSFPSDTTAVAFALAIGVWLSSRSLGWACLAWSAIVVGFPRIYAGFHYPTDVVGGALLGIVATLVFCKLINNWVLDKFLVIEQRSPSLFYSSTFVILFQITTLFDDVRIITRGLIRIQ